MENVTYSQTVTISWELPKGVRPKVHLAKLEQVFEDAMPTAEITWEPLRSSENIQEPPKTEEEKLRTEGGFVYSEKKIPDPNEALLDVIEVVESGVNFGIKALKQALKR